MMIDGEANIDGELENLIAWRKQKAERHPEDARNHKAVSIAERLLAEYKIGAKPDQLKKLNELGQQYEDLYAEMWDRHASKLVPDPLEEEISAYWRSIGFYSEPANIGEVCESLCELYAEGIQNLKELKSETAN